MGLPIKANFNAVIKSIRSDFETYASLVHTERWQGMDISKKPEMATMELLNHSFSMMIGTDNLLALAESIEPNLPWANDHFLERVGGQPLNPGKEWANWPYAASADRFRTNEQFTHSYMERYWPKEAGYTPGGVLEQTPDGLYPYHAGIRYQYGDLGDVVNQLDREPFTRQAILPVWFPEDTGAVHGGRVPCSIAYHFIRRGNALHVVYYLRSCDFVRHFRDDVYLTIRLMLWILEQLQARSHSRWGEVIPGIYTMHMTSLHIFRNDYRALGFKERQL